MPIERFRSFEEARDAIWRDPRDPDLGLRIRKIWSFARRLAPLPHPRGVWRFRNEQEAAQHREAWVDQRIRQLREQRQRP